MPSRPLPVRGPRRPLLLLPGLLLAFLLLLAASPAPAAEPQPEEPLTRIRLESILDYPDTPTSVWELMRRVFHPLGITVRGGPVPYARTFEDLLAGKIDAQMGTYFTHMRGVTYPRWHILLDQVVVLFKKGSPLPWQGFSSLANRRVGWVSGYRFHFFFKEPIPLEVMEVRDSAQCLALLVADRVEFCMEADNILTEAFLRQQGLDPDEYRQELVFQEPIYLRFSDTPRSHRLMALFDQRMDQMYASGELARIFDEFGWTPHITPEQGALAARPTFDPELERRGGDPRSQLIRYINAPTPAGGTAP